MDSFNLGYFHFAIIENLTITINHKLPLLYRNQDKLHIKTPKLALDNYQDLSSLQSKQIKTKIMNNFYRRTQAILIEK